MFPETRFFNINVCNVCVHNSDGLCKTEAPSGYGQDSNEDREQCNRNTKEAEAKQNRFCVTAIASFYVYTVSQDSVLTKSSCLLDSFCKIYILLWISI